MVARIYRPAKNAMQSGRGKTHEWVLDYKPEVPRSVEPLMGYTSSSDSSLRLQHLADEGHVVLLDDAHEEDRQVARDAMRPQTGLPELVSGEEIGSSTRSDPSA